MTKKKEKAVDDKKAVKLSDENEVTPYEAMDLADEDKSLTN